MLKDTRYIYIKKNMNIINPSDNNDFSLKSLINLFWNNKFTFIILTLLIFTFSFIFTYINFEAKSKDQYYIMPIFSNQIATINHDVDLKKILTIANVKQSLEKSNIESDPITIIKNINIIKGQQNLNVLLNNLSSQNTNRLIRELSIDISVLNRITKEVLKERNKFYELTLNYSNINLNEIEVKVFLNNLAAIMNENIVNLYPATKMNLKPYNYLDNKTDINDTNVTILYYKYNQIRESIDKLELNYPLIASDISLDDLDINAKLISAKIKFLVSNNLNVKDLLLYENQLVLNNFKSKISTIDSLLESLNTQYRGSPDNDLNQTSNSGENNGVSGDDSLSDINFLLNLGEEVQLTELKKELIHEKKDLSYEIINLSQNFQNMVSSDSIISTYSASKLDNLYLQTIDELNALTKQVNEHMYKIDSTLHNRNFIETISSPYLSDKMSHKYDFQSRIIYNLLFSIFISILFILANNLIFKKNDI